jgi:hypothetical protein
MNTMAFKPCKSDIVATTPFEYHPTTAAEEYAVGETLKLASGALTKASGTDTPVFIAQESATGAAGKKIAVYRIPKTMIFEVPLSADGSALAVGNKVTIASDGLRVTATTASGVAELVELGGTSSGSAVRVRL